MGKTAPLKQKGTASAHSRAARRATSPGIDTDKSLKDVKPPTDPVIRRPSILAAHQGSGVTKRSKNGRKVLSAKARKRHEKGMDRAEAVMDKKVIRVEKSRGRARTVQERAKNWEELNKRLADKKALEKENLENSAEEEMDEDQILGGDEETKPQSIPLPEPEQGEEKVL